MAKIYQLPKLYHPDFALPYKNPQGLVEIDTSNPFGFGEHNTRMAIGGRFNEVIKGGSLIFENGALMKGGVFSIPTDQDIVNIADCSFTDGSTDGVTIWLRVFYSTNGSLGGVWGATDAEQISLLQTTAGHAVQWLVEDDAGDRFGKTSTATLNTGWNTIALSFSVGVGPANTMIAVINGVQDPFSTDWQTGTVDQVKDSAGAYNWKISRVTAPCLGDYQYMGVSSRALNISQLLKLESAPFSYLQPQIPLTYFVPAAAPAGGNEPLFYHHQRMLSRCS